MKQYVIERDLPGVGGMSKPELSGAAGVSNAAIEKLSGKVEWQHSYVADNKTFCIYRAENEEAVLKHAELSGFPANTISEVKTIIDPTTAG
jgi:hypothetical protein